MKYNIKFAQSTFEFQSANNLVAQIYYQKKYISSTELPQFTNCEVVIVTDPITNELLGCASIRMPYGKFESEELYGLSPQLLSSIGFSKNKTVELGRFAIPPLAEGKGLNPVFFLMNWAIIKFLKKNGYLGWMAILKPDLYKCLNDFGYRLRNIDDELNLKPVIPDIYRQYFIKNPKLVYSSIEESDRTLSKYSIMAERFILKSEILEDVILEAN